MSDADNLVGRPAKAVLIFIGRKGDVHPLFDEQEVGAAACKAVYNIRLMRQRGAALKTFFSETMPDHNTEAGLLALFETLCARLVIMEETGAVEDLKEWLNE